MADTRSQEQKIIDRVLEVLALIDGTGNYLTTLGLQADGSRSVADSRPNWEQQDCPAVSVFQGDVEIEDRDDEGQKVLRAVKLLIRGTIKRDSDAAVAASNARKFLADIQRAIRTGGDRWIVSGTPLALRTEEGPHRIEYPESSFEIIGVQQEITITYIGSHMNLEA